MLISSSSSQCGRYAVCLFLLQSLAMTSVGRVVDASLHQSGSSERSRPTSCSTSLTYPTYSLLFFKRHSSNICTMGLQIPIIQLRNDIKGLEDVPHGFEIIHNSR
ncbi:hypothetical protein KC333_g44 [Hortaea werneckii]|nr:hypothetical protein KC333_g44 [Hortaea werneckii]